MQSHFLLQGDSKHKTFQDRLEEHGIHTLEEMHFREYHDVLYNPEKYLNKVHDAIDKMRGDGQSLRNEQLHHFHEVLKAMPYGGDSLQERIARDIVDLKYPFVRAKK